MVTLNLSNYFYKNFLFIKSKLKNRKINTRTGYNNDQQQQQVVISKVTERGR